MSSNLKRLTTIFIEYDRFEMSSAKPRSLYPGLSGLTLSWVAPLMLQPNDQLTPIIMIDSGQDLVVWPDCYFKCDIFLTVSLIDPCEIWQQIWIYMILRFIIQYSSLEFQCMSQNLTNEKYFLFSWMPWCRHATSHYLSQCWPKALWLNVVTKPQSVKSMVLVCVTPCWIDYHAYNIHVPTWYGCM